MPLSATKTEHLSTLLIESDDRRRPGRSTLPARSRLDLGRLPLAELATLGQREAQRPRPIYGAHKWFARRLGSAFRSLLVAAVTDHKEDFWKSYYGGASLHGIRVLDPFVGGGTSAMEAFRLGASVLAGDIDPVATAITRFELGAALVPDLKPTLEHLKTIVGKHLAPYYRTVDAAGNELVVLHHFWVQVVDCVRCGHQFDAHPHYRLAFEAEGTRQWVFCPSCSAVSERHRDAVRFCCPCGQTTKINAGTVSAGRATCPQCEHEERLIDVGRRTRRPPQWRLFAIEAAETVDSTGSVPLSERHFLPASAADIETYARAAREWQALQETAETQFPIAQIHSKGRSDTRLIDYGYQSYHDLFNARQLLHLALLRAEIAKLAPRFQVPFAIAFSNHLTTNCMLTAYAFGWRRLSPLFSIRAFRHVPRPVEINPWADGTGRGSFPNAVHRVTSAASFARSPLEPDIAGGFRATPSIAPLDHPVVRQVPASRLRHIPDDSVDIVLTDPPYFDNIAYSELSAFFRPWMQTLGLIPKMKGQDYIVRHELRGARAEPDTMDFEERLSTCFQEIARVLRPEGRLVFTFQHSTATAWLALARSLASAALQPLQVFPMLGNGDVGLQSHPGSATWDAVLVFRKRVGVSARALPLLLDQQLYQKVERHALKFERKIATSLPGRFRTADGLNLFRATCVAAALGLFGRVPASGRPLLSALDREMTGASRSTAPITEATHAAAR